MTVVIVAGLAGAAAIFWLTRIYLPGLADREPHVVARELRTLFVAILAIGALGSVSTGLVLLRRRRRLLATADPEAQRQARRVRVLAALYLVAVPAVFIAIYLQFELIVRRLAVR
jgi:hypothetical protein